jgi:hypothetical protein
MSPASEVLDGADVFTIPEQEVKAHHENICIAQ